MTPEYPGWSRLPCPSTSTTSASFAPSSTNCSAAPPMKSATTASTAMPHPAIRMPVCPVGTNRVRSPAASRPRTNSSCAVILPLLQSEPTVRQTWASTKRACPDETGRCAGGFRMSNSRAPVASARAARSGSSLR